MQPNQTTPAGYSLVRSTPREPTDPREQSIENPLMGWGREVVLQPWAIID